MAVNLWVCDEQKLTCSAADVWCRPLGSPSPSQNPRLHLPRRGADSDWFPRQQTGRTSERTLCSSTHPDPAAASRPPSCFYRETVATAVVTAAGSWPLTFDLLIEDCWVWHGLPGLNLLERPRHFPLGNNFPLWWTWPLTLPRLQFSAFEFQSSKQHKTKSCFLRGGEEVWKWQLS